MNEYCKQIIRGIKSETQERNSNFLEMNYYYKIIISKFTI